MSDSEKQVKSEAVEDALYPVHDRTKPALSSSESDISQDVYTSINERALLRKLDRTLLPAVTFLYLLSFLDRSNGMVLPHYTFPNCSRISHFVSVANARVEGLVKDLHMCTTIHSFGWDQINILYQPEIST